jgi:hypothetical protein
MAYIIGGLLGAILGMALVGGAAGWAIHKLFKVSRSTSDAIAMLLLAVVANFTNSSMFPPIPSGVVYGAAGVLAYFMLAALRSNATPVALSSRIEPDMNANQLPPSDVSRSEVASPEKAPARWRTFRKVAGGVLLTILGATGSTAMFNAFRQVVSPSYYGGTPEFSFLIGAVLLIPCIFIWRGLVR